MEEDSVGYECIEEGGGSNRRQEDIKIIERESSGVLCNAGLILQSQNGGSNTETAEVVSLQEQLCQDDCGSEERG